MDETLDTIKIYFKAIQKEIPSLSIEFKDGTGTIYVHDRILYSSQGMENPSFILAYLIGIWVGLNKGKNYNPGL